MWKEIITKCDRYYKERETLLRSVTGMKKYDRSLLQSATGITKCDNYNKVTRGSQS